MEVVVEYLGKTINFLLIWLGDCWIIGFGVELIKGLMGLINESNKDVQLFSFLVLLIALIKFVDWLYGHGLFS